jgi:hypothetical protein
MKVVFKDTAEFRHAVKADLRRRHPFAAERVGFVSVRAMSSDRMLVLLAEGYHPVSDRDYVNDPRVGAMLGQEALRKALEIALLQPVGMFHIHAHQHRGRPGFSRIDLREQVKFVPDFFKLRPEMPHGAIVLSEDRAAGRVWLSPTKIATISEFNTIGSRLDIDGAGSRPG